VPRVSANDEAADWIAGLPADSSVDYVRHTEVVANLARSSTSRRRTRAAIAAVDVVAAASGRPTMSDMASESVLTRAAALSMTPVTVHSSDGDAVHRDHARNFDPMPTTLAGEHR
jgi:hypothetical protein